MRTCVVMNLRHTNYFPPSRGGTAKFIASFICIYLFAIGKQKLWKDKFLPEIVSSYKGLNPMKVYCDSVFKIKYACFWYALILQAHIVVINSGNLRGFLQGTVQWLGFSRNIGLVTPKLVYFYHSQKRLGWNYPKNMLFDLENKKHCHTCTLPDCGLNTAPNDHTMTTQPHEHQCFCFQI